MLPTLLLTLILVATFGVAVHNLDHTAIWRWDEAFHAVVAQNVHREPLRPALIADPYLPYDYRVWWLNEVWLHKPILPFWQIALSFSVLGVNAFALRLPSALLAVGAVFFTYAIGRELLDRRTALLAAALQGVNPFLVAVVQGYQFADHVDAALLFWVEAGIFFLVRSLRTGTRRDLILAGVCQGLAFLSKSFLAGIILGLAVTAWLLPLIGAGSRERLRIAGRHLLLLPLVSAAVAAPWLLHCWLRFPAEFFHENVHVLWHMSSSIENWGAPWDRLVFDYLIAIHGVFYTPALVAAATLLPLLLRERSPGLWLTYAWGVGVIVPHVFAVTKTPSATLIGLPPFLLILSHFAVEAWKRRGGLLLLLSGVMVVNAAVPAVMRRTGQGPGKPPVFGSVMFEAPWVIEHVIGAFLLAGAGAAVWRLVRRGVRQDSRIGVVIEAGLLSVAMIVMAWLGYRQLDRAWQVTERNLQDPVSLELGTYARDFLPENAVLLCEVRSEYEHMPLMFYSGRTCYALDWRRVHRMASRVIAAGGVPFIVSPRDRPLEPVHRYRGKGTAIYRWDPGRVQP